MFSTTRQHPPWQVTNTFCFWCWLQLQPSSGPPYDPRIYISRSSCAGHHRLALGTRAACAPTASDYTVGTSSTQRPLMPLQQKHGTQKSLARQPRNNTPQKIVIPQRTADQRSTSNVFALLHLYQTKTMLLRALRHRNHEMASVDVDCASDACTKHVFKAAPPTGTETCAGTRKPPCITAQALPDT
jgi:hypothetical protein